MFKNIFKIRHLIPTIALTAIIVSHSYAGNQPPQTQKYEHRFHSGETLHIEILDEAELSREYKIDDTGMILMPLLGKIHIGGKTATDIEHILTLSLQDGYILNPIISVYPIEERTFYILGEVKSPGQYTLPRGQASILNAVALAGGFTPHARKNKFDLVRNKGEEKYHSQNNSAYTNLLPGDIIIVEERFF
ncbi:MAG: polysaccharide biosynthesis/export family protein [Alphaproteobacteria bacterium]